MPKHPIDYQRSPAEVPAWSVRHKATLGVGVGFALGFVMTLPAIFLAMASAGAGHGDYWFAKALFPIPMCVARYGGESFGVPSIALAVAQFSLYGVAIGYSSTVSRRALGAALLILALIHTLAFALCNQSRAFS